MATVVQAFILCATDDPLVAEDAVFRALNSGVFESDNPILDFISGTQSRLQINADYVDGSFVRHVPGAALMRTANSVMQPC